jgi:hypothetical protein
MMTFLASQISPISIAVDFIRCDFRPRPIRFGQAQRNRGHFARGGKGRHPNGVKQNGTQGGKS